MDWQLDSLIWRLSLRTKSLRYFVEVSKVISKTLEFPNMDDEKISKIITDYLNKKYPNGWICLLGKKFMANISH
mgnify:CR=1 FL=1